MIGLPIFFWKDFVSVDLISDLCLMSIFTLSPRLSPAALIPYRLCNNPRADATTCNVLYSTWQNPFRSQIVVKHIKTRISGF